jgi:predicted  nucleic acid-binding Zn-ribbon protein
MAMNVEAEIRDLKRRVSELEGSFGFLTRQIKGVHKDLLAFQARTEQRFDKNEKELRALRGEFGTLREEFGGLRDDMPGIVGTALREVLRERPRKSRKRS